MGELEEKDSFMTASTQNSVISMHNLEGYSHPHSTGFLKYHVLSMNGIAFGKQEKNS